ncbi:MAG: AMP-binding protein [Lentisphaeria bacterium]|nr:AMP-binding protein [Lentisphaeria bacterium]
MQNFSLKVPEHFNFAYDVVDVYAESEPERVALVWCNDHEEEVILTFAQLARRANQIANLLKSKGIGAGDRVMLVLKSRHEFWPAMIACHKLGAIVIPGTHMLKEHDLVYRFERASIKAIMAVASDNLMDEIDSAQAATGGILKLKISVSGPRDGWIDYQSEIDSCSDVWQAPPRAERNASDDPMLVYFTSGTSGMPKMVTHAYDIALAYIIVAKYWQNIEDGGLHYTVADTGWAKCIWGKLYGQWIAGSKVFVYDYDKFDAEKTLEKVVKYKVTTFCAPPTVYRFLIKQDLSRFDLSGIHYAVTAGEPLNPEVYYQFLHKTGLRIREAFGQTESIVFTANWPWDEPKPGSMGRPTPTLNLALVDSDGKQVEVGDEGEICLKTGDKHLPGLFLGYDNDAEQTRARWHEGLYHAGDMAWKDADGYLWFVGRADDVIKTSGYRVGPFEVESAVMEHPSVLECAITGVPDPTRGQVIKATIVLAKGYEPTDELKKEIQDFVKHNTAPYKYPRVVEFVSELPKTISGKIRRMEIREQQQKLWADAAAKEAQYQSEK